jgi:hypothetical protein
MVEAANVERIIFGLRAGNWDQVIGHWFSQNVPDQSFTDEELERITDSYLKLMANDILAAHSDGDVSG